MSTGQNLQPAGTHVGRAWAGHSIEDECPCLQQLCGLVDYGLAHPDCEHHPASRMKSMRQGHRAKDCPGGAR